MTTLQQPGHAKGPGTFRAPFLSRMHEWIATADHKKLGVMYVSTGLIFFLIAGLEGTMMRWQLAVPGKKFTHLGKFGAAVSDIASGDVGQDLYNRTEAMAKQGLMIRPAKVQNRARPPRLRLCTRVHVQHPVTHQP